jgi:hypothetical protein
MRWMHSPQKTRFLDEMPFEKPFEKGPENLHSKAFYLE